MGGGSIPYALLFAEASSPCAASCSSQTSTPTRLHVPQIVASCKLCVPEHGAECIQTRRHQTVGFWQDACAFKVRVDCRSHEGWLGKKSGSTDRATATCCREGAASCMPERRKLVVPTGAGSHGGGQVSIPRRKPQIERESDRGFLGLIWKYIGIERPTSTPKHRLENLAVDF